MHHAHLKKAVMITLNLTPTEEAHIVTVARQAELDLAEYVKKLIQEHLPLAAAASKPAVDDENAAAIAQLQAWTKEEAAADPEEAREAEADLRELMQNLNRNRVDSGERPLFP